MDLRQIMRADRILQWKVAKQIGISEFTLCRWLRPPVSEAHEALIREAIEEIKRGSEN